TLPLERQVRIPKRNRNCERASLTNSALHLHSTAMYVDEFLHECEPDSGSLVCPAAYAFRPMKALEDMGQFLRRDSGTRVLDHKDRQFVRAPQVDCDPSLVSELECI